MAVQKVTVPVPEYVKHVPHAVPGDENSAVSTSSISSGVFYSTSPLKYWQSISFDWTAAACPEEHFPVNVRYRVVSEDRSLSSGFSEPIILGTTPAYKVYHRFTDSDEPVGSFPWIGPIDASQTSIDAQRWGDSSSEAFVQFAVCGADKTVSGLDSATGAWSGTDYTVSELDTQVIGISVPTEIVV